MAGKWYLIGFATNAQWFVSRRTSMKVGTAMLTPTADGDLDMSYSSLKWVWDHPDLLFFYIFFFFKEIRVSCLNGFFAALMALVGEWTTWQRRLTWLESSRTQVNVSAPAHPHTRKSRTHRGAHATFTTKPSTVFLLLHDPLALLPPSGWGNVNDMRVVDVKYDEHALIHTIKTKGGDTTAVNKLYGKVIISHGATPCPMNPNVFGSSVKSCILQQMNLMWFDRPCNGPQPWTAGEVQAVLLGDWHPAWKYCFPSQKWYFFFYINWEVLCKNYLWLRVTLCTNHLTLSLAECPAA